MRQIILQVLLFVPALASAQWQMQVSGTRERFRGVSAVNDSVAWASGNRGTVVRTTDGGATWQSLTVPGADTLDFRDIEAMSASVAYMLSIGEGAKSRIYKTIDGGNQWTTSFAASDPRSFYDAIAFWDESTGLAVGDALDGRLTVVRTTDGGATWIPVGPMQLPPALPGEGAFAASGTSLIVGGKANAWIGSGVNCARVYSSTDKGESWAVASAPLESATSSSGVFSVAFIDERRGVVVGGDYQKMSESANSVAVSNDGGNSWALSQSMPSGFRSCVVAVPGAAPTLIAVGPNGSDYSLDFGNTWTRIDTTGFHAVSFAGRTAGWAVGENGGVAKFSGDFRDMKK